MIGKLLLLVFCVTCFRMEQAVTQRHVDELQKTKWGSTLLQMMQLHAQSKGPVQELITAIEDLEADLANELDQLKEDYDVRTNEHHVITTQLDQDIADAAIDYQRTVDTLENLLKPRRDQLKNKIQSIIEFQEGNRKTKEEDTLRRESSHEEFELQLEEYNGAVEAADSALNLLASLSNPSFIEIKKLHVALNLIEQRVRTHSQHAPLIKALITLASEQNFADQGIIGSIIDKLNEFRNAVVDAINASVAQEAQDQQEFEERVEQLDNEHAEFGKQITKITIDLNALVDKINELTQFASQRDQDRQIFQGQLDIENSTFAEETQIYTDLKNQYLKELGVVEQAAKLVSSANFADIKI